jgi:hypothetical protein
VLAINLLLEATSVTRSRRSSTACARVAGRRAWVSGVPIFRTESNRRSERELALFVPITIAAVAALLYAVFRSRRAVVIPLATSGVGTLCMLGAMGATHTPLTFSTIVLPPILLALGSAYTIHVLNATSGGRSLDELALGLREVARPVALSGLTTEIGFLGVALVQIAAIRDLGVFGAVGTLAVNAAAISLAPAALALLPFDAPAPRLRAVIGDAWGVALVDFVARRRGAVIATWIALIAALATGLPRLSVETDATRWFPIGSEVRDSYEAIRARLSGISPMNVVIGSHDGRSLATAEAVAAIDGLASELARRRRRRQGALDRGPAAPDPRRVRGNADAGLPADGALIEQYLLLLSSVDRIRDVLSDDRTSANVLLRVDDNSSNHLLDVARGAEDWWRAHGPPGTAARATGIMFEFARAEDEIAMGQIRGLAASLLVVGALALVIFRALRVAAVAILPDAIPLAMTFGFMGLVGHSARRGDRRGRLPRARDRRRRHDPPARGLHRAPAPPRRPASGARGHVPPRAAADAAHHVRDLDRLRRARTLAVRNDPELRAAHGGVRGRGAAHEPDAPARAAARDREALVARRRLEQRANRGVVDHAAEAAPEQRRGVGRDRGERHLRMVAPPAADVRAEPDQRVGVDRRGRRIEAERADRARDRLGDPRGESVQHHAEPRVREVDRRVAREYRVAFRVLAHVREERPQAALEHVARLARCGDRIADSSGDARDLGVHDRLEQPLLVAEVAIDDRARHPGPLRDLLERRGIESALREHPAGHIQELLRRSARGRRGFFFAATG